MQHNVTWYANVWLYLPAVLAMFVVVDHAAEGGDDIGQRGRGEVTVAQHRVQHLQAQL